MPKGWCPAYFYNNPELEKEKSIDEIYKEIQYYSLEFFETDELTYREKTDFMIPLPPLMYENHFVKGIFLSQGVDYIHSLFPKINQLFFSMAYSMWGSIPYSDKAEVYLNCYDNPKREAWFKKEYPNKKDKIFIPLQDADFTNEYTVAPSFAQRKDIDILCVSSMNKRKNIPMLLKALKLYHEKYGTKLKAVLITGAKYKKFNEEGQKIIAEMENEFDNKEELKEYLEIVGYVKFGNNLNRYYTRSKLLVLASIYEGKNRSINEALCCNTPVIVFKDLCKYTRGEDKAFPEDCGLYVPEFSVESLCDTIHEGLLSLDKFKPRYNYLKTNGRLNFINKCIDSIPYYKENIPDYVEGRIQDNLWVDLAMQANYQLSFNQFLYGANTAIHHVKLHENNTALMDFFYARFGIKK